MTEDAGKKRYIKDFLQQVKGGEGYIENIWIERFIRHPGTDGTGSTAKSLSGRKISNLRELLEDDLKYCFDEGHFTFRFIAALLGSGKTSLLNYLHELINTKLNYSERSIVIHFELATLLYIGVNQSFSIKLYCYILAKTFWQLIHNTNLSELKEVGEKILVELSKKDVNIQLNLKETQSESNFINKFLDYFGESKLSFEDVFFHLILEMSKVAPLFTFVYLIDELDALEKYPHHIQDTRSLFRALIKKALDKFQNKVRLLVYLAGTSNNLDTFIAEDSVLKSLVSGSVITLYSYTIEYEQIRETIDNRIEGAYKGYKDFAKAWKEIKNITINRENLRSFCKEYASSVLEIHEKYFKEAPEQVFEGNARELLETKCREKWKSYLRLSAYTIDVAPTTTLIGGHAFDCYAELRHNNNLVARAFGEAKNYELVIGHLETFVKWLEDKDVNFKPCYYQSHPPDIAFMIAPSCPALLQRKLEIKHIEFIQWNKIVETSNEEFNPESTEEFNTDVLAYLPKSQISFAWKIFTFITDEENKQITLEQLQEKYNSSKSPIFGLQGIPYYDRKKSIKNPLRDLRKFSLVNCEGELIKIAECLPNFAPWTIADYLSNILRNHIVVKSFFKKTGKGQNMSREKFEEMLLEVCYPNESRNENTIRSNSIRLIDWLDFAGLIEYRKISRETGFIYRPIGEGKNKGQLPSS